jgi:hypothetical protein
MSKRSIAARDFVLRECDREYKGAGITACHKGAIFASIEITRTGSTKGGQAASRCEHNYPDVGDVKRGRKVKYTGQLQDICKNASNTVARITRRAGKRR